MYNLMLYVYIYIYKNSIIYFMAKFSVCSRRRKRDA